MGVVPVCARCGRDWGWLRRQCFHCGCSSCMDESDFREAKMREVRQRAARLTAEIPSMESVDELTKIARGWRGSVHDMAVKRLAELARGNKP